MPTAPRVLVVDDERFFREGVRDALQDLGVICELAENADEALKRAEDPALEAVVLDVRLPGTSGIDVLRALRERRPALHVIVLSSHTDQDLVLEALRLGAADYLAKPIHDEELRLAVRRAVEGTRLASRFESLTACLDRLVFGGDELRDRTRSETSVDAVAEPAAMLAAEVLGAGRTSVLVAEGEVLRVAAIVGADLTSGEVSPASRIESMAGLALGADRVLRFEDVDRDERCAGRDRRGRYATQAALLAPLRVDGEDFGVVCVADPLVSDVFRAEDEALLALFADRLGALLSLAARRAGEHAASLQEDLAGEEVVEADADEHLQADLVRGTCEAMVDEIEPEAVLGAALEPIAQGLLAATALYTIDARDGELRLEVRRDAGERSDRERLPRDRGLTAMVLQGGRLVAVETPEKDARFDPEVDTPDDGVPGPLLILPLAVRGRVLGLARIHPGRSGQASARTGELLSAGLSAALRNALLYRSLLESIEDVARARREAGGRRAG